MKLYFSKFICYCALPSLGINSPPQKKIKGTPGSLKPLKGPSFLEGAAIPRRDYINFGTELFAYKIAPRTKYRQVL